MQRKTALVTVDRGPMGGNDFNYITYSNMFKSFEPHQFGVRTSQLFSAKPGREIVNKKFTYMTIAKGNVFVTEGGKDEYEWSMVGNAYVPATVTADLLGGGTTPGKGNTRFKIALDRDWYAEPVVLKTEDSNGPLLRIIGFPVPLGNNSWEYTVEVQSSNPNDYCDPAYLQPGRTLIDISTAVADSMNMKGGGDQYAQMFKLRSQIGNFSRKLTVDDKTIRAEIAARKRGQRFNQSGYDGVGVGYVFNQTMTGANKEKIEQGVFITAMEARLLDHVEMDREMAMEFGRLQNTTDNDTNRALKVAPGWRQIVQDGHYFQHNGNLTLTDLYDYFTAIYSGRTEFSDRRIRILTGEGGLLTLHTLIQQTAGSLLTLDTLFTDKVYAPYHSNALAFGAQYTVWRAPNGLIIELIHDPVKDNKSLFPEIAPGTQYTVESFCMDIMDFGATDQRATGATREENITMVIQEGVDAYWTTSGVYNFTSGAEMSGGNVLPIKEATIQREMSGALCVWDTSRVGRIEYVPAVNY